MNNAGHGSNIFMNFKIRFKTTSTYTIKYKPRKINVNVRIIKIKMY